MYIVDMHCDSLSAVSAERGLITPYNVSDKNPALQFFAQFSANRHGDAFAKRKRAASHTNVYLSECERLGLATVKSGRDMLTAFEEGRRAALFSIEGGGGLLADSPELDTLVRAGLSVYGMVWDKNELAASAYEEDDTGLTDEGKRMLARCEELGLIIDVSHMSDKSFYDTFELSPMPHIATHSNFREICPAKRNLTREMAEMIAKRGGVIGLNLYPAFLNESGTATCDDILRHVDYALEYLGDRCLGFGCDIDGTSGKYPVGITEESSIHEQLIDILLSHYSASTVERIAGLNVVEFLENNLR